VLGPRREAAQPVFARYWLHNRGPAPAGYHPAMVYLEPRVIELAGPTTVQLIVSATGNAAGKVDLIIPPGITVTSQGSLDFDLSDGYRRFELLVAPDANAVPGVCHLAARIPAEHGQVIEDVCTIRMGAASLAGPRITARTDPPALAVCPGESSPVYVLLTNHCLDEVRGEAQLITPFGTWDITGPRTHAFAIPPGKDRVLKYQVRVPEGAPPAASWVLIKVMSFGEITYTESIPLTIGATTTF
jgi:alpha-mannosidase